MKERKVWVTFVAESNSIIFITIAAHAADRSLTSNHANSHFRPLATTNHLAFVFPQFE
jgi:hypothetical protein